MAIQDADLEYSPSDLKRLVVPLIEGQADVVLGSRFLSGGSHRVLYFWHSLGNKFLTFLSNMLTDLNLTDMETCYKVFRREVIQSIEIEENRFGFEPEIVAKVAQRRLNVYEMGISYNGRTYAEGKKIGMRDGWRALYCILKYNLHKAPWAIQFLFYLFIGGTAAIVNLVTFLLFVRADVRVEVAAPAAFLIAAAVNYYLSILLPLPASSEMELRRRDPDLSARHRRHRVRRSADDALVHSRWDRSVDREAARDGHWPGPQLFSQALSGVPGARQSGLGGVEGLAAARPTVRPFARCPRASCRRRPPILSR